MAPDTMVAVVAQNTRLNTKLEKSNPSYAVKRSNPGFPINPTRSSPIKSPKPIRMNTTVPIQKSIRFFIMMFPVFFALVKPASTIANPACIQNTSAAPIKNHTLKTLPDTFSSIKALIAVASITIHLLCGLMYPPKSLAECIQP